MSELPRKVAIVGSARIPFCRSNTAYSRESNHSMLTATLNALVNKYNLAGERLGEVASGTVMHLRPTTSTWLASAWAKLHPAR